MDNFKKLLDVVATLRGPGGCPWDKEQTLYSMKDGFVEEAYELVSALDNKDIPNVCEELGDVLLHVVLHAQIAKEDGLFDIDDVMKHISEKLIRRHPHVFGDTVVKDSKEVLKNWDAIKATEKGAIKPQRTLDKANRGLPTLPKAEKLQKAAAKVGFDWPSPGEVMKKADEELSELKEACAANDKEAIKEELGDLMFVFANLARHYGFSADEALRAANEKFVRRFNYVEDNIVKSGKTLPESTLDEMEALWQKAKGLDKP